MNRWPTITPIPFKCREVHKLKILEMPLFITTTLGGLVVAVSVGMTVGAVAGALVRPRFDRARNQVVSSLRRTFRRDCRDAKAGQDSWSRRT